MKILFISGCPPASFNHGEPNSYPYYLIKEFSQDNECRVLFYNHNSKLSTPEVIKNLSKINVKHSDEIRPSRFAVFVKTCLYIPRSLLVKLMIRLGLSPVKKLVPLPYSVYKKEPDKTFYNGINEFNPELILIFPIQMRFIISKLSNKGYNISVLCTDSPKLHFIRQLQVTERISVNPNHTIQMLHQNDRFEQSFKQIKCNYLFVGKKDQQEFSKSINNLHPTHFIPHHLYSSTLPNTADWSIETPIRILFAGGKSIYTGDEPDRICQAISISELSRNKFHFIFLGSGYDSCEKILKDAGYGTTLLTWVENYDTFLQTIHIQIFPIILGTGTKAKVLSAITSGILCIGTEFAFENILVNNADLVKYNQAESIPRVLRNIEHSREKFKRLADQTRQTVFAQHATRKVCRDILRLSIKNKPF